MNYWEGVMNWPVEKGWKCEICGGEGLTWGLPHATCRCDDCHVQYRMRNKKDEVVTRPICHLKPEYYEPMKILWEKLKKPVDEIPDAEWDAVLAKH